MRTGYFGFGAAAAAAAALCVCAETARADWTIENIPAQPIAGWEVVRHSPVAEYQGKVYAILEPPTGSSYTDWYYIQRLACFDPANPSAGWTFATSEGFIVLEPGGETGSLGVRAMAVYDGQLWIAGDWYNIGFPSQAGSSPCSSGGVSSESYGLYGCSSYPAHRPCAREYANMSITRYNATSHELEPGSWNQNYGAVYAKGTNCLSAAPCGGASSYPGGSSVSVTNRGYVFDMIVFNGELYIGGNFGIVNRLRCSTGEVVTPAYSVAKWVEPSGSSGGWAPVGAGVGGGFLAAQPVMAGIVDSAYPAIVYDLEEYGEHLFAAGPRGINTSSGSPAFELSYGVVRLNDIGVWQAFGAVGTRNPNFDSGYRHEIFGNARALAVHNGTLYVGGTFDTINSGDHVAAPSTCELAIRVAKWVSGKWAPVGPNTGESGLGRYDSLILSAVSLGETSGDVYQSKGVDALRTLGGRLFASGSFLYRADTNCVSGCGTSAIRYPILRIAELTCDGTAWEQVANGFGTESTGGPVTKLTPIRTALGPTLWATGSLTASGSLSVGPNAAVIRYARCLGDVDRDGDVDFTDLNAVLGEYSTAGTCISNCTSSTGKFTDLNCDGVVDFLDLNEVLGAYPSTCP